MKKTNTIIAFLLVLVAVVGCKKDTDPAAEAPEVKVIKVTPRQHGATFEWDVVDMPGKFQTCVELSRHDDMSDLFSLPAYETETSFVANIDTLTANTTYYYRYVVWNKFKRFEFEKGGTPFTTLETPTPGQDTTYYTISVSWQPEEGGTATGGGRIAEGDTCTLTATANEGYRFVNWTEGEGNSVADTAAIFSFVVTADRALVANFTSQEYTINAIADPIEGGVVEGWGGYNSGDECTLTAIANEGYEFVNWTKDDEVVSDEPDYPFTVTESATYVAHFRLKRYKIRVSATDGGAAYVGVMVGTLETTYTHGDTCVVHALPEPDYHFVNWTELGIEASREENYRFCVTSERILVANFEVQAPNTYTITVSADPSNGGQVTGGGSFQQGRTCTVTATPYTGYDFVNWTENDTVASTNQDYTFTLQGDRNLVAHFQVKSYTIRVITNGSNGSAYVGEIVGTIQATYTHGQTCWIHARANSGYAFENWTESDTIVSPNANYRFEVKGDRTFVANFTELQPDEFSITVSANPSDGGEVEGAGVYEDGEECMLTAIPADCYKFTSWSDGSTDNPHTVEVTGDAEYTANFERSTDTITVNAGTGGTAHVGSSTGPTSQPVDCGASCTIYAVADEHYEFDNWTEGSTVVSPDPTHTVDNVTENHTFKANFKKQTYHISVSANPTNGGTVSGGGDYEYNQSCTVTATPAQHYHFVNWTDENGAVASTQASYPFNVTGDRHLIANFELDTYQITVTANPSAGGSVTGGGTYNHGQSCTVTATPNTNSHYHFVNWTDENGAVASTQASYTFNVTANRNLKANFEIDTYQITVTANPANGGTVQINNGTAGSTASGTFAYGTTIQLKATANSGYNFSQWNDGLAQTHNVMVTGVATYTATFTSQPQAPTGALPGKFTRNANGDKVYFSKGNLQYNAIQGSHQCADGTTKPGTWRFAENQYDCIGSDNNNISQTYNGWIDLFGWGTSGYHDSNDPYNVNYQPWSTSTDSINGTYNWYGYGPSTNMPSPNLTGSSANYDWGYNAISNGGGQSGQWRTLTGWTDNNNTGEWNYIFNIRSASTVNGVANARYAKAKVANVQGVILFPDEYTHPGGVAQPVGINETGDAGWNGNDYSASDFASMQDAGAVFLPAAGYRNGTSVYGVGSRGLYWSASYYGSNSAHGVYFGDTYLYAGDGYSYRCYGRSVRLVCPAE
jgi:hypothetical protein